jgi:hypothetical protein
MNAVIAAVTTRAAQVMSGMGQRLMVALRRNLGQQAMTAMDRSTITMGLGI